ncbi:unnamed protein product [Urochloa humidicola]
MGVVYYQYMSEKGIYSIQVPHAFISASELKQLIKMSEKYGTGRTRGRPTEDIIIYNAQTREEYTDERALVLQNTTVLVRRISITGQLSEKIVLSPVREVTEGCSAPSKSVVTDSNSKSCNSIGVQDEDAAIAAVINAAEMKLEQHPSKRGQAGGRRNYGIRDYIIAESKCICGVKALADDLIPNQTLRSTINNMLGTQANSGGSGTTKHRSSSGSNADPRSQSHIPSASSEMRMKQSTNLQLSVASGPDGLQVGTEGDLVNQPLEKWAANVTTLTKDEGNSVEVSAEKALASAEVLKVKDGSGSTSKIATVSGALEHDATRTNQPKKKRKKADSTKNAQLNNVEYGHNVPFDSAYYNPFVGGYPCVPEPYMYSSMGMPYGGYPIDPYGFPMDPYGVNSFNGMPPQALAMQGYPATYQRPETQPTNYRGSEAVAARPRQVERPKDISLQPQLSKRNRQLGSSHGSESRNRTRSSSERRDHGRSDRASDEYENHSSRRRMCDPSPVYGNKHSSRRSRPGSRGLNREDSSDDERNFKRRWGRH